MNGLLEVNLDVDILSDEPFALNLLAAFLKEVFNVIALCRVPLEDYALGVRDCEQLLLVYR